MTKKEAIEEMKNGMAVRHLFFSDNESIYMKHGLIYDERHQVLNDFWKYRTGKKWETDWEMVYTN